MTQSPTLAEVQAAYYRMSFGIVGERVSHEDISVILAAVARDTLGWREVDRETWIKHQGPCKNIPPYGIGTDLWLIKDAAP